MTLFIACLLIYGFDLPWWLYPIAATLWFVRAKLLHGALQEEFQLVRNR